MGKRAFHKMIANPITNIEKLTESYKITDYVLKMIYIMIFINI